MAKALVVGGTGFIGSHLTQKLLQKNINIKVISKSRKTPLFGDWQGSVDIVNIDIRNKSDVSNAIKNEKFDYVFNLGGYIDHAPFSKGGREVMDHHWLGTVHLIENLDRRHLKSFIQIGSSDEYGDAPSPQKEDIRERPIAPYSIGKVAANHLIQHLYKTESFPGVILRLFLVYGPGQDEKRFLPQIIRGCLEGKSFQTSEGKQERDFCYVDDIVAGLIRAAEQRKGQGEILNLASGKAQTVRQVIEKVVSTIGGGQPNFGAHPYRPGENMSLVADIKKAQSFLGWSPQISFNEGLGKTISFYKEKMALF